MRELLLFGLGNCGINIASAFIQQMQIEHGLNQKTGQLQGDHDFNDIFNLEVYFEETLNSFTPRSLFIDIDSTSIENLKSSELGRQIDQSDFICSRLQSNSVYSKAYNQGLYLKDIIEDSIKRKLEQCDSLMGFQMINGLGGGAGSALNRFVLDVLEERESLKSIKNQILVFPSPEIFQSVTEPYNAILGLDSSIDHYSLINYLDNQQISKICLEKQNIPYPDINDLNRVVAQFMCEYTACQRFYGENNNNLRKLCINLVPFEKLMFVRGSMVPNELAYTNYNKITGEQLLTSIFKEENFLNTSFGLQKQSLALAYSLGTRGSLLKEEMGSQKIQKILQMKYQSIYGLFQQSNCQVSSRKLGCNSAHVTVNSFGIISYLDTLLESFDVLFEKRRFFHYYLEQGSEELQFRDSREKIIEIKARYEACTNLDDESNTNLDEESY